MKQIFFSIILILFLPILLLSQIKIEEKIEIEPKNAKGRNYPTITSGYGYTPCGPYPNKNSPNHFYQVVWKGAMYDLAPQRQHFKYQSNSYIPGVTSPFDISIISGSCKIMERVPIPDIENGWTRILAPNSLSQVTLEESGAITDSELFSWMGIESAFFWGAVKYTISFPDTGIALYSITENGTTNYYHTYVVPKDYYLTYSSLTIPHGEYDELDYSPHSDECVIDEWYGSFLNGGGIDPLYSARQETGVANVSLALDKYIDGIIPIEYNSQFLNYNQYDNLLVWANGALPMYEPLNSSITITSINPTLNPITIPVKVDYNNEYPIGVVIDPFEFAIGDTVNINLLKRIQEYGNFNTGEADYTAFPSDQVFTISIEKGAEFGEIYSVSLNETGKSLTASGNFKFIANGHINKPDEVIIFRAQTTIEGYDNGEIDVKIISDNEETEGNSVIKQSNKENNAEITSYSFSKKRTRDIMGIGYARISEKTSTKIEAMLYSNTAKPGDTVGIGLLKPIEGCSNCYTPFPPDQKFEIGLDKGCEFGTLLNSSFIPGNYFKDEPQPFYFVVSENPLSDSGNVVVRAGIPEDASTSFKIQSKIVLNKEEELPIEKRVYQNSLKYYNYLEQKEVLAKNNTKSSNLEVTTNMCSINNYQYDEYDLAGMTVIADVS